MIIDQASGWIDGVRRVVSPNYEERPVGAELALIVLHGISLPPGEFGNGWIDRFFC
ncbi:MAG: 1,6-anhydro-N-acetylmuramyl-L-alanine amidase AmpD, partial [Lysobacterales bacterium]